MLLKIYLLERIGRTGYDEFYGCVVAAKDAVDALTITPNAGIFTGEDPEWVSNESEIRCTEIGVADKTQKRGVILASFNAG